MKDKTCKKCGVHIDRRVRLDGYCGPCFTIMQRHVYAVTYQAAVGDGRDYEAASLMAMETQVKWTHQHAWR